MTGADALRAAIPQLREAGVEDAARDARVLLAHAMGVPPDRLTLHLPDRLNAAQTAAFAEAVSARLARQPVSQIVGHRLFWGRLFDVTPDVLDPRPETEVLVMASLSGRFDRVLDLGTGSGCILLTLLLERGDATGIGVDLSGAALKVAARNITRHALSARATLHQGDWFSGLAGSFDLIVANPPYVAAADMASLAPEVREWEPQLALTPGGDGLEAYRAICAGARAHLTAGGRLVVEIGPTQGAAVAGLMQAAGFVTIEVLPDMDRRDRVVTGQNP